MPIKESTIALVVEAENRNDARGKASRVLAGFSANVKQAGAVCTIEPPFPLVPAEGDPPAGLQILDELWGLQHEGYLIDLKIMAGDIAMHHEALPGLLELVDFRSACYRLGTLEGPPVRVYGPEGDGITWPSNLESLKQGMPDETGQPLLDVSKLWVVPVDIL